MLTDCPVFVYAQSAAWPNCVVFLSPGEIGVLICKLCMPSLREKDQEVEKEEAVKVQYHQHCQHIILGHWHSR